MGDWSKKKVPKKLWESSRIFRASRWSFIVEGEAVDEIDGFWLIGDGILIYYCFWANGLSSETGSLFSTRVILIWMYVGFVGEACAVTQT